MSHCIDIVFSENSLSFNVLKEFAYKIDLVDIAGQKVSLFSNYELFLGIRLRDSYIFLYFHAQIRSIQMKQAMESDAHQISYERLAEDKIFFNIVFCKSITLGTQENALSKLWGIIRVDFLPNSHGKKSIRKAVPSLSSD